MMRLVDFLDTLADDVLVKLYVGDMPFVGYWPLARIRACFDSDCPITCTDIETDDDGDVKIHLDKDSIV